MYGNVFYNQYNTGNTYDYYSLFLLYLCLRGDTKELILTSSVKVSLVCVLYQWTWAFGSLLSY